VDLWPIVLLYGRPCERQGSNTIAAARNVWRGSGGHIFYRWKMLKSFASVIICTRCMYNGADVFVHKVPERIPLA